MKEEELPLNSLSLSRNLPIIQKLVAAYKLWQEFLMHFPKSSKYTLGEKIDAQLLEIIEITFEASQLYKSEKISLLQTISQRTKLLKFLLQISWEIKALNNNKYILISRQIFEIEKMLNGWVRQLIKENSPQGGEKQSQFLTARKR